MYGTAREVFSRAVLQLKLPRSSTVVVGLSGGPDSVALTYLARQTFRRVVAVTVDHRLREESGEEAERAGEVARGLGAEHLVIRLDWERERGGKGSTGSRARHMRYTALLKECQRMSGDVLMVGHHANDQIETMLQRLSMCSGVVGLGGMHLVSYWAVTPKLPIVRPLLGCAKSSLIQLCKEEGLQWVNDPSNNDPVSVRNRLRPVITRHPSLIPELMEMASVCRDARDSAHSQIGKATERLARVDTKHGILSFDANPYGSLNPYVARSVLAIWLRYISCSGNTVNRNTLEKWHNIVVGRYMIARQKPLGGSMQRVSIRVGQTIVWDNRLRITLFARSSTGQWTVDDDLVSKVFYVRNFITSDHAYVLRGVRKIKMAVLVHHHVRGGLPVITDADGEVVLIPHFNVINHAVGVDCSVTFAPTWSMRQLLNYHYIADDSTHPITAQ